MRRSFNRISLIPSTTGTGTDSGTGSSFEVGTYETGVFFLDISTGSGTTCTLNIAVQTYDVLGADWYDLGTFAQGTAAGTEMLVLGSIGERIRGSYTVGGTTPTFVFTVGGVVKS